MEDVLLPQDGALGAPPSLSIDPGSIHPQGMNTSPFPDDLPNLTDFGNDDDPTFSFRSIDVAPDFFDRNTPPSFPPIPSIPLAAKPIVDTSSAFPPREQLSSPVTNRVKGEHDWSQPHWSGKLFADTVAPSHVHRAPGIRAVLQEFSRENISQQHILCKLFLSLIHRTRERASLFDKPPPPDPARAWPLPPRGTRWLSGVGISVDSARAAAPSLLARQAAATHSASTALSSGAPFKLGGPRAATAGERRLRAATGADGLTASRHCHICCRPARAAEPHVVCGNLAAGVCRKSICQRCFADVEWTGKVSATEARAMGTAWRCPHCEETCPDRAQCFVYRRTSERRRQRRNARRAAAAAGAATTGAEARWRGAETAAGPAVAAEWLVDPEENGVGAIAGTFTQAGSGGEAEGAEKEDGRVVADLSDRQSGSGAEPIEKKQKTGDGENVEALLSAPGDDMTTPVSPLSPTEAVGLDIKDEATAVEVADVSVKEKKNAGGDEVVEQDPPSLPDVDEEGEMGMGEDFLFRSLMDSNI